MILINKLLKIAGKDDFQLAEEISTKYIIRLCWKYAGMMVRGRIFSLGQSTIAKNVFVGKRVVTLEKKRLTIGARTRLHDGVYIDALSRKAGGGGTSWRTYCFGQKYQD